MIRKFPVDLSSERYDSVYVIVLLDQLYEKTKSFQIETIVNPLRSGMRTIKNMPDTLVGGRFQSAIKLLRRGFFCFALSVLTTQESVARIFGENRKIKKAFVRLRRIIRPIHERSALCIVGVAKILLGRGTSKETAFLQETPLYLDQSSEYPALTAALKLLDEVFDLQARSQWLRRGLINRLLGM